MSPKCRPGAPSQRGRAKAGNGNKGKAWGFAAAWRFKRPSKDSGARGALRIEVLGADQVLVVAPPTVASVLKAAGGASAGRGRWHFPAVAFGKLLQLLGTGTCVPPSWALVALGREFRRHSEAVQVPKKTAHVLVRDVPKERAPSWQHESARLPQGEGWPTSLEEFQSTDGRRLLPYQREAVEFGLRNAGRVLLGDEMGLGKTAQALALVAHYAHEWPLLIVCPSSLCAAWAREAVRWLPAGALGPGGNPVQILARGCEGQRRLARIVVVSYDLLAQHGRFQQCASGGGFRVVVCDEAHFLKSAASQRTHALLPILKRARRAVLLTGTPAVNNAAELYPLLDALLPGLVPSREAFCARYCREHPVPGRRGRCTFVWRGSTRPDELHRMLLQTVMIRRLKAQVLPQLPTKVRQRVRLDAEKLCKDAMSEIARIRSSMRPPGAGSKSKESLVELLAESVAKEQAGSVALHEEAPPAETASRTPSSQQVIADMARLTCKAKAGAAADYVERVVRAGVRFLLFAHHRAMLDALEERLAKLDARHIRIDGSTVPAKRTALVADFQRDDGVQVALLSITACGQGLNLQSASVVVFAELYWVVGQMLQAEDRVHRVGQASAVNIHYLIAPGTLDDAMHEVLQHKHRDTTATLDGHGQKLPIDGVAPVAGGTASLPGLPDPPSEVPATKRRRRGRGRGRATGRGRGGSEPAILAALRHGADVDPIDPV